MSILALSNFAIRSAAMSLPAYSVAYDLVTADRLVSSHVGRVVAVELPFVRFGRFRTIGDDVVATYRFVVRGENSTARVTVVVERRMGTWRLNSGTIATENGRQIPLEPRTIAPRGPTDSGVG